MTPRRLSRLLIALPSDRMGGTERHTAELAARLAARGLAVTLAADPALHPALRPLAGSGVALAALPEDGARLVAAARPDLAILPLPWPDAAAGLDRALAGVTRLILLHLAAEACAPVAMAEDRAAMFAAVSTPLARRAERIFGLAPGRVAVLPNPGPKPAAADRALTRATLRQALRLRADAPLTLFVGRLEEAKGAELLPAVSERLTATLAVAGDGPLRGLLESRAAGDPRGLLRVLGAVADPTPWFLAADALLLPSRLEGAPLVFLEAAANRLPVVATAAALEALGEAAPRLARIAAPDPAALANALAGLLRDPAGAAPMVEAAAAHAARQDWEGVTARVLTLLRVAACAGERAA